MKQTFVAFCEEYNHVMQICFWESVLCVFDNSAVENSKFIFSWEIYLIILIYIYNIYICNGSTFYLRSHVGQRVIIDFVLISNANSNFVFGYQNQMFIWISKRINKSS